MTNIASDQVTQSPDGDTDSGIPRWLKISLGLTLVILVAILASLSMRRAAIVAAANEKVDVALRNGENELAQHKIDKAEEFLKQASAVKSADRGSQIDAFKGKIEAHKTSIEVEWLAEKTRLTVLGSRKAQELEPQSVPRPVDKESVERRKDDAIRDVARVLAKREDLRHRNLHIENEKLKTLEGFARRASGLPENRGPLQFYESREEEFYQRIRDELRSEWKFFGEEEVRTIAAGYGVVMQ